MKNLSGRRANNCATATAAASPRVGARPAVEANTGPMLWRMTRPLYGPWIDLPILTFSRGTGSATESGAQ